MAAGHLALLCLGLCILITNVSSQRRCSVPVWRPELGSNPITANRGKVLLVALLRGYCSYCVGQAGGLQVLRDNLASQGLRDIAMIVVNGGETISRNNVHNLQNASNIPVLQDTSSHVMFRQVFLGNKDDFVVYDRCGQRVAYIPHPYSNLANNITERVLRAVHMGRHNCHCRLDRGRTNPGDVMYGDQPGGPAYTISDNNLALDCPTNDTLCRRYERNHRTNQLSNRHRSRPLLSENDAEQGNVQRGRAGRNHNNRQHQGRRHGNNRVRNSGPV